MKTKQMNKVREMVGSRPGRSSAGRANGGQVGKRKADEESKFTGFGDVGQACHAWLMKHDLLYRRNRERRVEEDFLRQGRRMEEVSSAE